MLELSDSTQLPSDAAFVPSPASPVGSRLRGPPVLALQAVRGSATRPAPPGIISPLALSCAATVLDGGFGALVDVPTHRNMCGFFSVSFALYGTLEHAYALETLSKRAQAAGLSACGHIESHPMRQYKSAANDKQDMLAALATSTVLGTSSIKELQDELDNVSNNRGINLATFSGLGNEIFEGRVRIQIWGSCPLSEDPRGFRKYCDTLPLGAEGVSTVHLWHEGKPDVQHGMRLGVSHYQVITRITPTTGDYFEVPPVPGARDPATLLTSPSLQLGALRKMYATKLADTARQLDQIMYYGNLPWHVLHSDLSKLVHAHGCTGDNRHLLHTIENYKLEEEIPDMPPYDEETRRRPAGSPSPPASPIHINTDSESDNAAGGWEPTGGRKPSRPPATSPAVSPSSSHTSPPAVLPPSSRMSPPAVLPSSSRMSPPAKPAGWPYALRRRVPPLPSSAAGPAPQPPPASGREPESGRPLGRPAPAPSPAPAPAPRPPDAAGPRRRATSGAPAGDPAPGAGAAAGSGAAGPARVARANTRSSARSASGGPPRAPSAPAPRDPASAAKAQSGEGKST